MKKKYFIQILIFLLPIISFANDIESHKTIQYLRGDGDLESWFMDAFTRLDVFIEARAVQASILGRAIGGFGAMIYLAIIGYRMQNGEAEWSIEPMLKPLIIGIILINWVSFTRLISYPFEGLSQPQIGYFNNIEKQADDLRTKRFQKQNQVLDATIKLKAQNDVKTQNFWTKVGNGNIGEAFGDKLDELTSPVAEFGERLNYKLQNMLGDFLETICLLILRTSVYFIFFIQKVWAYILVVLGPIAVGMSMIPGFESSFNNWIAKFININLYVFIAYTIINIGQLIIITGYTMDIDRLSKLVDDNGNVINEALLLMYTTKNGMITSVVFPCVGYLVSSAGVLMTPTIADAIVSAGGAGIMTKAKASAGKVANTTKTAGKSIGGALSRGFSAMKEGNPLSMKNLMKK